MSNSRINERLENDKKENIPDENKKKLDEHFKQGLTRFVSSVGREIDESSFKQEEDSKYGDSVYSIKLKPQQTEEKKPSEENKELPKSKDEEICSLSNFDFLDRYNKVHRELTGYCGILLMGAIDTKAKREEYNKVLIHYEMLLILKRYGVRPEAVMSREAAQSPFILSIFNKDTTSTTPDKIIETECKFKL